MSTSVFHADSALMRALTRIADVMILNLLFVAASIPIVTLGASLTALNATAMRIGSGRCESVSGDFLRSFRANLKQGTILGLAIAGMGAVLAAWWWVVTTAGLDAVLQLVLLAVWFVLAFQLVLVALFAFPYLATFDDRVPVVLRNARLLSWKHPFTALAAALLGALPVVITVFFPVMTVYGLLWFAILFAGIAVVAGLLFTRVFAPYIREADHASALETTPEQNP